MITDCNKAELVALVSKSRCCAESLHPASQSYTIEVVQCSVAGLLLSAAGASSSEVNSRWKSIHEYHYVTFQLRRSVQLWQPLEQPNFLHKYRGLRGQFG